MSALHWAFAKLVIRKVRIKYLNSTDYSTDLYKKARSGELRGFTGIDSKYEEPENPDLILNAGQETENECVQRLLRFLYEKKIIPDTVSLIKVIFISDTLLGNASTLRTSSSRIVCDRGTEEIHPD